MFCDNCGERLRDAAKYCPSCGVQVAAASPPPADSDASVNASRWRYSTNIRRHVCVAHSLSECSTCGEKPAALSVTDAQTRHQERAATSVGQVFLTPPQAIAKPRNSGRRWAAIAVVLFTVAGVAVASFFVSGDKGGQAQDAVLGGPPSAFDKALGERARPGSEGPDLSVYTYLPCDEGGERPQLSVTFLHGKAQSVNYGPCESRVIADLAVAESEAARFFPPGTTTLRDIVTGDGEPARVFQSATLAHAYDEQIPQFRDCEGNPVEPGTFTLVVMENEWFMAPGSCP